MENKGIKFLNILLGIFVFLSVACIGYAIYYSFNDITTTVVTGYVNNLSYVEDNSIFPIEINYFTNQANNGKELFEIRLNYYTDSEKPETFGDYKNVYSSGLQAGSDSVVFLNEPSLVKKDYIGQIELQNCYLYNTTNGTSYKAISKLTEMSSWIFDMNGVLCQINSIGPVEYNHVDFLGFRVWTGYVNYDINYMIYVLSKSVESLPNGNHILQFDLSKFFKFQIIKDNGNGGTYYEKVTGGDLKFTIVNIKINKSTNGMIDKSQSFFKMVYNRSDWNFGYQSDDNFFNTKTNYYLRETDFDYVSYESGYLAILKPSALEFLKNFSDLFIIVDLNLNSQYLFLRDTNLIGFGANAFGILPIDKIVLSSDSLQDFYIFNDFENFVLSNINLILGVV